MGMSPERAPDPRTDAGGGEPYALQSPGHTAAEYEPEIYPPRKPLDLGPAPQEPAQYTLRELLGLVTAVAVVLGLLGCIPGGYAPAIMAGVSGVAALVGLAVMGLVKPRRHIVMVAWWCLLAFYVAACVGAVVSAVRAR